MKYKYLLFDLDGTVSESAEGIRASLEYAINTLGAPMPDLSDYTRYVGPPLIDTFLNLVGLDPETAERGAQLYRDYYNEKGKFLNRVYKGIPELLGRLREEDVKMCICSSKYELFAEEIIGILGLSGDFDAVCGSNIDGSRKDKKDLIPYAVACLGGDFERDRERTVMLGDTWYDAKGAKLCGVDFIGVRYGYGKTADMEEQGAKLFADTPGELYELLK
ncbi:MAG: HAD hydrolase-like protein [Ruminococcus sp.]|jgi:phosphoglycolate phosphatase|nr:HAD hydrolase-like protein [uncultured Ruminococcus sp.]MBQ1453554.1 HAD hydrolase-like protein [Ruminococcus sp.]MDO4892353.1 HAD hydrolase-like protein [Eubacteriales bacterium]